MIVLGLLAFISYNNFKLFSENFDNLLETNRENQIFIQIEKDIIELQRNVLVYSYVGYKGILRKITFIQKKLDSKFALIRPIAEQDDEIYDRFERMFNHYVHYKEAFNDAVKKRAELKGLRKITLEPLVRKSHEILHKLTDDLENSGNYRAAYMASIIERDLLQADINIKSFEEIPDAKLIDKTDYLIIKMRISAIKLQQKLLNNEESASQLSTFINLISQYKETFSEIITINRVYLHLVNVVLAGKAAEIDALSRELDMLVTNRSEAISGKITKSFQNSQKNYLILSLIAALVGIVSSLLIAMGIARPVNAMASTLSQLARGHSAMEIPGQDRKDEVGQMAKAANEFKAMAVRIEDQRISIRENEVRLSAIVDNMVDGLITFNESGRIESINSACEKIFGFSAEEVLGENVKILMPEHHQSQHDGYLRNYQTTDEKKIIGIGREVEGQRKNGQIFPMDLSISELTLSGKKMFVGMVRDISERKRIERMKSEFVSTVSHELRTPLTSISGALGLIVGGIFGELPKQAQHMIDIAHNNSQRLTFLINDLLDMEKLVAGKMHFDIQPHDLQTLIEKSIEENATYGSQRKVSLYLTNKAPIINIQVDNQRFMQIMSNLLSNAIKYSPENGTVEIAVTESGDTVRIAVSDHGPGIPAEFHKKIFQKFAQADSSDTRQKGGTGLGLAITRELVEKMAGEISFRSTEGEGACFFFDLPMQQPQQTQEPRSQALAPHAIGHPILIIEDEPEIANILQTMLTSAGYTIEMAQNGREALAALENKHYSAITLDLGLPDIGGLEIIRRLRQQPETAKLPIIVVSAHAEAGQLAINNDFSDIEWVAKPIDQVQLLDLVQKHASKYRNPKPGILHIEDDTDLHQVIRATVNGNYHFASAISLAEAREQLSKFRFDVIILDIGLPDGSGWKLLPEIRSQQPDARIVILSGADTSLDEASHVDVVLLKSKVSLQRLLEVIERQIH